MTVRNYSFVFGCIVSLIIIIGIGYIVNKQQDQLNELAYVLNGKGFVLPHVATSGAQEVQKVITKSEVWRPIQEKAKDTVVQVFSQVAEINLLQPYKTPAQYARYGSAFFINDQGDLITNAHVVNQAKTIWIQIPSLGKRIVDVELIGLSPDHDLALLRVSPAHVEMIRQELGSIPYLPLGDSDSVQRSDEILALGYPLGQQSLKSTSGVISGREDKFIQMSAPINPGNSGGPLLDVNGTVIGVNSAAITGAQNIGYIIPVNDLNNILPDLYHLKLLRKPFLGILFNNGSSELTEFLGNPSPGGCYVVEVIKNSTLYKAGVQTGDMLYEINGMRIDLFGEMNVPWSEDKLSISNYVSRLSVGQDVDLVFYRNGLRKEINIKFSQTEQPPIKKIYPGYESLDYEIMGGMVVTELSMNHISLLASKAPGLVKYTEAKYQQHSVLVITHIFPSSQLYRSRTITIGSTINEINGIKVHSLQDFREALQSGANNKFLTIKATDNVTRASDNILVVLSLETVLQEEPTLARDYFYAMTKTVQELRSFLNADEKQSEGTGSFKIT